MQNSAIFLRVLFLTSIVTAFVADADKVDTSTKEFKKFIDDIIYKYNTESKSEWYIIPFGEITAEKETIPGVTYHVKLTMRPSNCSKDHIYEHILDPSTCKPAGAAGSSVRVNAKIYISQVDNVEEITFE